MGLSEIISVAISQETQAVTAAGFGKPMILGSSTPIGGTWTERIRRYTGIEGVAEDFLSSDPEYLAASAMLAADVKVSEFFIARRTSLVQAVKTLTLAGDLVAANVISVTVNGETVEETFDTNHQTTMTALATAIAAVDGVASAVLSGAPYRVITITATSGRTLTVTDAGITGGVGQTTATIATSDAGNTVADDLDAIVLENDEWYAFGLTSRTEADQLTAAAWTEPRVKGFFPCSSAAGILAATTTDVGAKLDALGYHRTVPLYSGDTGEYAEFAWMGECLPLDPGTETWAYKTLTGVTADDGLTATEVANAEGKHVNLYRTFSGVKVTRHGYASSGRFFDQTRGVDALQAALQEAVFSLLVRVPKIPFTDEGIALMENEIRGVLFSDDWSNPRGALLDRDTIVVTVPKAADVSTNDKANRLLPDIEFSATLQGGIHKAQVAGVVSV